MANYFLPDPIASDSVFLETLNFYFMKTANIPVYGNVAVYALVCLKIDCTLRCLEYICSVSSRLSYHRLSLLHALMPLNCEDTDKCTLNYYIPGGLSLVFKDVPYNLNYKYYKNTYF